MHCTVIFLRQVKIRCKNDNSFNSIIIVSAAIFIPYSLIVRTVPTKSAQSPVIITTQKSLNIVYTIRTYFHIVQPFTVHPHNFPLVSECTTYKKTSKQSTITQCTHTYSCMHTDIGCTHVHIHLRTRMHI